MNWTEEYTQTVSWNLRGGGTSVSTTSSNLRSAQVSAYAFAINCGWTPRKWWQFWRWDEQPNPPPDILRDAYRMEADAAAQVASVKDAPDA